MKVSWVDKISNEKVLAQVNEPRTMLNSIWAIKHRWIGHVYGMMNYLTLWKKEWLENLQEAGEGYKC